MVVTPIMINFLFGLVCRQLHSPGAIRPTRPRPQTTGCSRRISLSPNGSDSQRVSLVTRTPAPIGPGPAAAPNMTRVTAGARHPDGSPPCRGPMVGWHRVLSGCPETRGVLSRAGVPGRARPGWGEVDGAGRTGCAAALPVGGRGCGRPGRPENVLLPSMAALDTDDGTVQPPLSLVLIATAVSQLFSGPISDRCGRPPVLLIGLAPPIGLSRMGRSARPVYPDP